MNTVNLITRFVKVALDAGGITIVVAPATVVAATGGDLTSVAITALMSVIVAVIRSGVIHVDAADSVIQHLLEEIYPPTAPVSLIMQTSVDKTA